MLKDILEKKRNKKEVPIIYSTSFLSFSTDDIISKKLSDRRISSDQTRDTIIKLNPLDQAKNHKIMETNAFLSEISFYHDENEVLSFPFSSFELVGIQEQSPFTTIKSDYSLRFKDKIEGRSDDGTICVIN